MILSSILNIADFWGWLQIIGTILGIVFIYRYRKPLTEKYIKSIEKDVYKTIGVPASVLFNVEVPNRINYKKMYKTIEKKEMTKNKRNVSELTKKIVASRQKWKCLECRELLDFTYEVDHIKPLYKGGSNDLSNLRALCRNCHGRITLLDRVN
jgi:5-methylcytosine-specific restriction endonuclease McrA